ncbi:hypothetical protein CCANI_05210 [Corynebacterium canis]|nr:hypothetical protein CCANI_05210 [Corynebacterium canis]
MKKFRTIAGQRLHTTYRQAGPSGASQTMRVEFSRTIGPATSASGRSDTASSASCGNTTNRRLACRICLSKGSPAGGRRMFNAAGE